MHLIWSLEIGGAEQVVLNLAKGADRSRFNSMVCCLNWKGQMAQELEVAGIPVVALGKKPKFDPGVIAKLVEVLRRNRIHVLHCHLWTASFWGRLAARIAKVPVVIITEHNIDTWRRPWHLLADRILAKWTDQIVCVSEAVCAFYRERLGRSSGKCRVIHNGIDLARFNRNGPHDPAAVRTQLGLPAAGRVVGTVGRVSEERKGHKFFVEAMQTLSGQEPDLSGLIVGGGKLLGEVERHRDALGLRDRVCLPGFWPNARLAEVLSVMDIFVLPSFMEGLPLVILEAMAVGKPVVATTVGGNAEAVEEGVTGWLVPPGDLPAFNAAVLKLLRTPGLIERMGEAGRKRVEERFSLAAMVGAQQEVYRRALERKVGGPVKQEA